MADSEKIVCWYDFSQFQISFCCNTAVRMQQTVPFSLSFRVRKTVCVMHACIKNLCISLYFMCVANSAWFVLQVGTSLL